MDTQRRVHPMDKIVQHKPSKLVYAAQSSEEWTDLYVGETKQPLHRRTVQHRTPVWRWQCLCWPDHSSFWWIIGDLSGAIQLHLSCILSFGLDFCARVSVHECFCVCSSVVPLCFCARVTLEWQNQQRKWPNFARPVWSKRMGSYDHMIQQSLRVSTSSRLDWLTFSIMFQAENSIIHVSFRVNSFV